MDSGYDRAMRCGRLSAAVQNVDYHWFTPRAKQPCSNRMLVLEPQLCKYSTPYEIHHFSNFAIEWYNDFIGCEEFKRLFFHLELYYASS